MASASQPDLIREERGEYRLTPEQQAEKDAYRARLRAFLEDPASRQIEGFPIGENEDILALSDPPYYTACPNPFLVEILEKWQKERQQSPSPKMGEGPGLALPAPVPQAQVSEVEVVRAYHREPFAADVSEGKNDPIYNAHSYHTKVPHKAIMRYILHYTEPGDIVFDGFCGTGMTGVAAQLCGDKKTIESLGYRVDEDGYIYDTGSPLPLGEGRGGEVRKPISKLGARKALLVDLSPAATFIAYNYNTPVDMPAFEREARRILDEVQAECGWMYETEHIPGTKGRINFTIWSDVFVCPQCGTEMVFWDVAVDKDKGEVRGNWSCPSCAAHLAKRKHKDTDAINVEHAWEMVYDRALQKTVRRAKQEPVLINYAVGKKRYEKRPDADDLALILKIENSDIPYQFPIDRMPEGDESRRNDDIGITHAHHFYTRRNLWVLAVLWQRIQSCEPRIATFLSFCFTANLRSVTRLASIAFSYYFQGGGGPINAGTKGTLYISSTIPEVQVLRAFLGRVEDVATILEIAPISHQRIILSTQSATLLKFIGANTIDYVFVDPPFGGNLMYSELSFFWEAWLQVKTDSQNEAIINQSQRKALPEYQVLMEQSFEQFYRILKPGHWMTVEFHNSKNSVWNAIQEALQRAGFVVADVRTFDKKQGSFVQYTATGSVKQDLIITAYKPNDRLEERFRLEAGTIDGAWDFVRYHLGQLPRVVEKDGEVEVVAERQAYLLFDRMVAFHIQRGASVPLSASEFYAGLKQRFAERDGMYFLPDQVAEYDSVRLRLGRVAQLSLFVSNEKTAIQWLRQQLEPSLGGKPQTFAELQPQFMREAHKAGHEQMPELGEILVQNFLEDERGHWYPPNPSKTSDLERLRLRALLKEFATYLEGRGRLRQFRTEAVRAGFAEAYRERNHAVILQVAARLPEDVLHEDPDLLMYFDTATLRAAQ